MLALAVIFVTLVLSAALLLYGTAVCIYNVFFHPLRDYPGPLLARATHLYYFYYELRGNSHLQVADLHEKYGEVVRITPNELSYNTGRAWKHIYGHRNSSKMGLFDKDPSFSNIPNSALPTISMLNAQDSDHRRMRRLQSHAFSEKALNGQESIIKHYADLLVSQLRKRTSGPNGCVVDMVSWYNFTTFDIIGDLALGEPFGCLRDASTHPFVSFILDFFKYDVYMRSCRRLPSPLKEVFLGTIPKSIPSTAEKQANWCTEMARKRMAEGTERQDFMWYMMRANDEKGMTPAEMEANAQLLILAGSETTATLLSGVTFHLLTNPRVLDLLLGEIQKSFTTEEEINMSSVQQLEYLQAVLEEGLRIKPPSPIAFPRMTPFPGENICDKFVPAGTIVGINQIACNRSPNNFAECNSFIPERFLGDPRFRNDDMSALNPFSQGPRNCIGKSLAYAEMRMILTRVLWNFEMELQPDSYYWDTGMKTFLTWAKPALNIKLTRRVHGGP